MRGVIGVSDNGCKSFIPYSAIVGVHIEPEKKITEVITGGIRGVWTPPRIKKEETGKFLTVITAINGVRIQFTCDTIERAQEIFNEITEGEIK